MADIIDLQARRNADSAPDADCVWREVIGGKIVTTYKFIGSYEFDGDEWLFEIWATDHEQAERKLKALSAGKIDGQVYSVIPA